MTVPIHPGPGCAVTAATGLASLRDDAAGCTRCHLYKEATQTVFGAGPADADLMLIDEQPGDQEDRQGAPFVGPAGGVLDDALRDAGIERGRNPYVTNVVKHFKFTRRGKRRIHDAAHPRQAEPRGGHGLRALAGR